MKIVFVFFIFFIHYGALAQLQGQAKLDSLLHVLAQEKEDTNKVKTLSRISQYYYYSVPLKAFPYANQALQLAEKLSWQRGIANMHNNLGLYVGDTGNHTLAIQHYLLSYEINKKMGARVNQVNNLNNIGRSYQFEGDFATASSWFYKGLAIAEEFKDDDLVSLVATNLAFCFASQEDYIKGKKYAEMALKSGTRAGNPARVIISLAQLGSFSMTEKDTAGAKQYFEKAIETALSENDQIDAADVMASMSEIYLAGDTAQINLLTRANAIIVQLNPGSEIAVTNYLKLGTAYFGRAMKVPAPDKIAYLNKAETWLQQAKTLAERNASPVKIAKASMVLSQIAEARGEATVALQLFKKATAINDSVFSQEKKNTIAGLESKHSLAVKDDEIAINKLMLANQRKTQWGLIAGLAFLLLLGVLLVWQNQNRKKTNSTLIVLNNELDEANKIKARFFSILSHELRSPIVSIVHLLQLQKENPGLLTAAQQLSLQQKISAAAEGLLHSMEAMLLWSKEQMNYFRPAIKNIAVEELFQHLRQSLVYTDNISFTFIDDEKLILSTDLNYLQTIMQNLSSNAIRALKNTPAAAIEWKAVKVNNQIRLSITDNGPGMSPERANGLFDQKIMNNEKHGLGLQLVKDLAKAIHCTIAVQSEPGKGTMFTLSTAAG